MLMHNSTMSSREIAEHAGKRHKDVLEAIRAMEPAWEKVTGRKFPLSEYTDSTGRKLPQYELSKKECLYIATKFNDEARAKLIMRWEELETKAQQIDFSNPATVLQLAQNWADEQQKRLEAERLVQQKEEQLKLQEHVIKQSAPKVEYHDAVINSTSLFTTTEIANELGFTSAKAMHQKLKEAGILRKVNGTWALCAQYSGKGYAKYKTHPYTDHNNQPQTAHHLYWTEEGRKMLHRFISSLKKTA